jgi:hypothetical protein
MVVKRWPTMPVHPIIPTRYCFIFLLPFVSQLENRLKNLRQSSIIGLIIPSIIPQSAPLVNFFGQHIL